MAGDAFCGEMAKMLARLSWGKGFLGMIEVEKALKEAESDESRLAVADGYVCALVDGA